ncbi:MAG: hypothetical protein HRT73_00570 [Flavobacteriales bacterium]|nr:hypothetical protein [Flavobacteriales bacterium]
MKLAISLKRVKIFSILIIMLYTVGACNSSKSISPSEEENKGWEIVKVDKKNDKPTWEIYSRKLVGTNTYEYKIEGDIESSPKSCVSSFRKDIYNQSNNPNNKKYPTYNILNESKDTLLTYVIHNEPFIFKDTEMRVRYTFFKDFENNIEGVKWKEAWKEDLAPSPSKKLSRVQHFRGSWSFLKTSSSHSKAVNIIQFDPKGMPMWLVRPMVMSFLRKGLENLRVMTSK